MSDELLRRARQILDGARYPGWQLALARYVRASEPLLRAVDELAQLSRDAALRPPERFAPPAFDSSDYDGYQRRGAPFDERLTSAAPVPNSGASSGASPPATTTGAAESLQAALDAVHFTEPHIEPVCTECGAPLFVPGRCAACAEGRR